MVSMALPLAGNYLISTLYSKVGVQSEVTRSNGMTEDHSITFSFILLFASWQCHPRADFINLMVTCSALKLLICTCRRDVIQPLSQQGGSEGCRVIAFDRPPYGLSERPMTWPEGPEGNPYTSEASSFCAMASSSCLKCIYIWDS